MAGVDLTCMGQGLTVPQKLAAKNSLTRLKVMAGLQSIYFWGKIMGTEKDYLIAISYSVSDVIDKQFYVSSDDGVTFSLLPGIDDFVAEKSPLIHMMFKGNLAQTYKDPTKVKVVNEDGEEEEEEEEEDEEEEDGEEGETKKPKERKLTELERLSWTVMTIENDTAIIPKGIMVLTPVGDITRNMHFKGLSSTEIRSMDNFVLFRDPQLTSTFARIRKAGISNNASFLDQLGEEKPKGVYTLNVSASGMVATIRSLEWPGAETTVEAGDSRGLSFGRVYFGTGLKNHDVLFMV